MKIDRRVNFDKAVSPVIATILMVAITVVLSGVLYVWAANLAENNTDGDFELYSVSARNAPGELSTSTDNNIAVLSMDQGKDIDWAKVDIKLSIDGGAPYNCATPGSTSGACIIVESNTEGTFWSVGEEVTIVENGVDLCNTDVCSIEVTVVDNRAGKTLDKSSATVESTPLPVDPCYSKVLYNTASHQVLTKNDVESGGTGWILLNEEDYPDYNHPAYYNSSVRQVLDCTPSDFVEDWVLVSQNSGSNNNQDGSTGEDTQTSSNPCDERVLYNSVTHQVFTQNEVENGGTGWILLDENDYPDYTHPAYYNSSVRDVLDCSDGDSVGDWVLVENNNPCDDKVLYNTVNHQMFTKTDVENGGTGWVLLDEQDYPEYNHPAYYNTSIRDVLDCSENDSVGDWILTENNHNSA